MDREFPAEWFAPYGLWVAAIPPIGPDTPTTARQVIAIGEGEAAYVPAFTSEAEVRGLAAWLPPGPSAALVPVSSDDPRRLGEMLDCLVVLGLRQIAINPRPGHEPDRIPIRDLAAALHRHLLGHRHAGGSYPN